MADNKNILIYAYGNPGRQDDGLGNKMIELLEKWREENRKDQVYLDSNYQLNVEDATEMHNKDLVLFVDASMEDSIQDFAITKVKPSDKMEFSMHATSPGYLLYLCEYMYKSCPPTYLLHIKGYSWEFNEPATAAAMDNLYKAYEHLVNLIENEHISETNFSFSHN